MQRQDPAKEFKARKKLLNSGVPAVISTGAPEDSDEKVPLLKEGKGDDYPYGTVEV